MHELDTDRAAVHTTPPRHLVLRGRGSGVLYIGVDVQRQPIEGINVRLKITPASERRGKRVVP